MKLENILLTYWCLWLFALESVTNYAWANSITSPSNSESAPRLEELEIVRHGTKWYHTTSNHRETYVLFRPIFAHFFTSETPHRAKASENSSNQSSYQYVRIGVVGQQNHQRILTDNLRNCAKVDKCYCNFIYDDSSSQGNADISTHGKVNTPAKYSTIRGKIANFMRSPVSFSGSRSSFSNVYYLTCEVPSVPETKGRIPLAVAPMLDSGQRGQPYHVPGSGDQSKGIKPTLEWFVDEGFKYGSQALFIHGRDNLAVQTKDIKEVLLCVSPHVGDDAITEDYDDLPLLTAFLAHHVSLLSNPAKASFLIYNPIGSGLSGRAERWLQALQAVLKRKAAQGVDLEFVPDFRDVPHWDAEKKKAAVSELKNATEAALRAKSDSDSSSSHTFPWELFPDYCMQRAHQRFKFVLLLDYTEFIYPAIPDNSNATIGLLELTHNLDQAHPKALAFSLPSVATAHNAHCTPGATSTAVGYISAAVGCKGAHIHASIAPPHMEPSSRRNLIRTDRNPLTHNHSHVSTVRFDMENKPPVPVSLVKVSMGTALVVSYRLSNFVKHAMPRVDVATQQQVAGYHAVDAFIRQPTIGLHYKNMLQHPFTSFLGNVTISQRTSNPTGNSGTLSSSFSSSNKVHRNPYRGNFMTHPHHPLARLMMFSTVNPVKEKKDPSEWARKILAMSSWIKLALDAPADRIIIRVLVITPSEEHCEIIANEVFPRGQHHGKLGGSMSSRRSPLLCLTDSQCGHPYFGQIPTMDCLFKLAVHTAHPGEYIMYANSDMIFGADLYWTFLQAWDARPQLPGNEFAMVGRRNSIAVKKKLLRHPSDISIPTNVDYTKWDDPFILRAISTILDPSYNEGSVGQDSNYCQDFFVIPHWFFPEKLHPFLVGKLLIDDSLLQNA